MVFPSPSQLRITNGRIITLMAVILLPLGALQPLSAQQAVYGLDNVEKIGTSILKGPEDVAADKQGNIFTGCSDGVLYKVSPQGTISRFAATGGRPLGLYFAPYGDLLVCDAGRKEVLSITPGGVVRVIARSADDKPLVFPDPGSHPW
jgi:sugar lactone lactonase YvrE